MRILALETSLQGGSIALLDADQLAWQTDLPTEKRTAQNPGSRHSRGVGESRLVQSGCRAGGSSQRPRFVYGLRIGVTTAKVFAYAAGSQIIDLNTLERDCGSVPLASAAVRCRARALGRDGCPAGRTVCGPFQGRRQRVVEHGHSYLCGVPHRLVFPTPPPGRCHRARTARP